MGMGTTQTTSLTWINFLHSFLVINNQSNFFVGLVQGATKITQTNLKQALHGHCKLIQQSDQIEIILALTTSWPQCS